MAYNDSTYKAANRYKKDNIKRVPLDMQIAEYERVKAAAEASGEKVNEYIKKAIRQRMAQDGIPQEGDPGLGFGISDGCSSAK